MMRTRAFALILAAGLAASSIVEAATPGATTYSQKQPEQRTRSPKTRRSWGMSFSGAGDFKILKASEATSEAEEQLFYYDAQVSVSCSERSPNRAHRSQVLAYWTQAQSATVSIGRESYCTPSGTSCVPPVYNLGRDAGLMTYVNDDGANAVSQGACFEVPCGVGPVFNILPSEAFRDHTAASYRSRACTNGHPCRVDADCSDSTTCSASKSVLGAFLGLVPTSTSVDALIAEQL